MLNIGIKKQKYHIISSRIELKHWTDIEAGTTKNSIETDDIRIRGNNINVNQILFNFVYFYHYLFIIHQQNIVSK